MLQIFPREWKFIDADVKARERELGLEKLEC